ncbi:MAG TPA: DUF4902 domain-containing protein [Ideonella sp.]|uniref:DUF4902 domain-containing protein n=1 Tax=Ideonella sp. TaxID=1929293 RepID=UPI002D1B07CE|nr:DUF4902 domain-containing protein [Ideonella sp.]HSI50342.1 DUF4902 domain-containing protein [Ideonella sp.]
METELRSSFSDSYVRLHEEALFAVALIHLHSACETSAQFHTFAGYAEWASESEPRVSIGWDWRWRAGNDAPEVVPYSLRSNVMLVDERGIDLGLSRTLDAVRQRIDTLPWMPEITACLAAR